ncbi:MAG: hypothetical protein V1793_06135 [Pseudomonadota bacterium]
MIIDLFLHPKIPVSEPFSGDEPSHGQERNRVTVKELAQALNLTIAAVHRGVDARIRGGYAGEHPGQLTWRLLF